MDNEGLEVIESAWSWSWTKRRRPAWLLVGGKVVPVNVTRISHGNITKYRCPIRYQTRHFFNNFTTNEDIATTFEADLPHCVRNLTTTNLLLFKFRCNIFIRVRIIKDMPGSVASGTPCIISWRYRTKQMYCSWDHCGGFSEDILVSLPLPSQDMKDHFNLHRKFLLCVVMWH